MFSLLDIKSRDLNHISYFFETSNGKKSKKSEGQLENIFARGPVCVIGWGAPKKAKIRMINIIAVPTTIIGVAFVVHALIAAIVVQNMGITVPDAQVCSFLKGNIAYYAYPVACPICNEFIH